ncbi:flagellar biosynthesis protein flip [Aquitalea magnusonii]|uniref:flagellar type III secretion system pore protein FliP n=1 Tax=Aquitalea TaxID=407217 RepID=UPI0005F7DA21|nr:MULTISPECIES: flagellar type III secretion system pore protein FliP [Aquitalea]KJV25596.1 flagellar biosynthesis protein flip [Aquitalea magnusonii]NWK76438.1 flagellar type III secretion system pore protein FliP [Aquitalea sp. LB_tupeE]QBJ76767.1 flagellar biosynthetic protein FliP [Aquitalea sp. USM4]
MKFTSRVLPWLLLGLPMLAQAAGLPLMTSTPGAGGGQNYSLSLQMLLFMTALGFIPAMLLMTTAFTRIVIVLSLLRQAMGVTQSPPNQVILGLSLFLTLFVMGPTFDQVYNKAWAPFSDDKISFNQAVEEASKPMKAFMLSQTREKDLAFFIEISRSEKPATKADVSMKTLIPAYVISELKTAFQIGFMVFIPFMIIDLVVASILMAMGMMMVSPVTISLPFKLMLFVLVDGWTLLMGSLVQSFYTG